MSQGWWGSGFVDPFWHTWTPPWTKKPLTRVSKRVPGAHGKRGLERGLRKRLAKGWRKVGEGLAKGWHRVGTGLADFLAPSNFGIPEAAVQRHGFVTPWLESNTSSSRKAQAICPIVNVVDLCGSPLQSYRGIILHLAGLETQTQNAAFFERKRPKRKPWHRGKS